MINNTINKVSEFILIAVFFLLCIIWVLPHTIAMRNILLGLGFFFSLIYLITNKKIFFINKSLAPLTILLTLFIWVLCHYFFFSINPEIELKEIKSLWLRSFIGVFFAICLAIIVRKCWLKRMLFFLALSSTPLINLGVYIFHSYSKQMLIPPIDFVTVFLFNKIEVAFFGGISSAVFFAWLLSSCLEKQNLKRIFIECVLFAFCLLFGISSLVSSTKNGMAISLGLFTLFSCCLIFLAIVKYDHHKKYLIGILICFISVIFLTKLHLSSAASGWNNFYADIKVAVQVDKFQNWTSRELGYPLNEYGDGVAGNTYERMAWATIGWRLISKEPFGYGSINDSFRGMLNLHKISNNVIGQTHSGWTDFGLAFGLPGLGIIILAQLMIIYIGLKNKDPYSLIGVWICIALLPLGLIAEICYKQYFEATLFFIAFAATMVYRRLPDKTNEALTLKSS